MPEFLQQLQDEHSIRQGKVSEYMSKDTTFSDLRFEQIDVPGQGKNNYASVSRTVNIASVAKDGKWVKLNGI